MVGCEVAIAREPKGTKSATLVGVVEIGRCQMGWFLRLTMRRRRRRRRRIRLLVSVMFALEWMGQLVWTLAWTRMPGLIWILLPMRTGKLAVMPGLELNSGYASTAPRTARWAWPGASDHPTVRLGFGSVVLRVAVPLAYHPGTFQVAAPPALQSATLDEAPVHHPGSHGLARQWEYRHLSTRSEACFVRRVWHQLQVQQAL